MVPAEMMIDCKVSLRSAATGLQGRGQADVDNLHGGAVLGRGDLDRIARNICDVEEDETRRHVKPNRRRKAQPSTPDAPSRGTD